MLYCLETNSVRRVASAGIGEFFTENFSARVTLTAESAFRPVLQRPFNYAR